MEINTNKTKEIICGPLARTTVQTYRPSWLGGLLVERRTSVSQIRGSIPGQVAAV